MENTRYRFECRDVADCDIIIYGEFRESVFEAARSHLKDVHGREVADEDIATYIKEIAE